MKKTSIYQLALSVMIAVSVMFQSCDKPKQQIQFDTEEDQSWVFWYWMYASVSKEGITADLQAMKEAGIGGAYLMPIYGEQDPPLFEPSAQQLSDEWWEMVKHAIDEAERFGLELGFHASDGFAVAGGPWITPEQSMQKVVWSETYVEGGQSFNGSLRQPETIENYYRDIAVFAVPLQNQPVSSFDLNPEVTFSLADSTLNFLGKDQTDIKFKSDDPCWIQFEFESPFTCRSIRPYGPSSNLQWQRMRMEASMDGVNFKEVVQMKPARQGWQNWDEKSTYSIPPTNAKYFRFHWTPEGSEPGSEDLDAGKWKAKLVLQNIELLSESKIHHYEGKTGLVWRVSGRTREEQIPTISCAKKDEVVDLTDKLDVDGVLNWEVPEGQWKVLRMGHTSTGHTNYTGGGGLGLECDKFSKEATKKQFDNWFGAIQEQAGPELSKKVISMFHVDSWECGSQNWSQNFAVEFQTRRGYDLKPYLPILAGIPLGSADESERFLYDFRTTISELYIENFYEALLNLAHENGVQFSAENVSPTMLSDGMRHFASVDKPMGEFWLRSPTHDKPNDMLDAISGAHIYGKQIVQAEAFTQLRMDWDEHPGNLKALGDAQYAKGINKLFYHVFAHNPWMDMQPGMTLNGVGLYFQRNQTWWNPGKAWVEYHRRCQALLQNGHHVADIAVFTGEELPRRAMLPERLMDVMPGLFDKDILDREITRRINRGTPTRVEPYKVTHMANLAINFPWFDPLNGYKYDSFNPHALETAKVVDGKVVFGEGTSYALLVIPGKTLLNPEGQLMNVKTAQKLVDLAIEGATIQIEEDIEKTPGLIAENDQLNELVDQLLGGTFAQKGNLRIKSLGKGRIIKGDYGEPSLEPINVMPDAQILDWNGNDLDDVDWTHRKGQGFDIYFITNQADAAREITASFRVSGYKPEVFDPVTGELADANQWTINQNRTEMKLRLESNGAQFVLFRNQTKKTSSDEGENWPTYQSFLPINGSWDLQFDSAFGGPELPVSFPDLSDWTESDDPDIKYYSGTATYTKSLEIEKLEKRRYWLDLGEVANIAEVKVNGKSCGITWTPPYQVEVTNALIEGENMLEIAVTNTWQNRLIRDHDLPEEERITNAPKVPYLLEGRPLTKSGLLGPVSLMVHQKK